MSKLLIVDDEQSMRDFLSIMLKKEGYEVAAAETAFAAAKAVQGEIFDLVISDVRMPGMDGIALLKTVKEVSPETVVIMITAHATAESAVEAMKLGAYDYIMKPFKVDEIKLIIQNALEKRILRNENTLLKREMKSRLGFDNFVGASEPMQRVFTLIRQVADTNSTVLISGESGTGKELVARAIHENSVRKERPFVTVNCGALPETLLESELFGYMKGAFTGAISNKQGLFEAASNGTIFLDEISATTPALQIKLLRVLQERVFMRVGGTSEIKVDVRVVAASNRDLRAEVSRGTFREDLYYRLNVIPIQLPALRERKEDIPLLVHFFLSRFREGRHQKKILPDAVSLLMNYNWPGNVRELENTIERLVILSPTDEITADLVPVQVKEFQPVPDEIPAEIPDEGLDLEKLLVNTEKRLLQKALEKAGGVKTEAAKLLNLTFRSFRHRLNKYES